MRLLAVVAMSALLSAQEVPRPRITGLAHVALYVHDVEEARKFYTGLLGYEEPFSLKNGDGSLSLTFVKINERQYVELFPEREAGSDRLNHISIETDDIDGMRRYLASKGVKVPATVPRGRIGNANFNIKDPAGHTVEIVQYLPAGQTVQAKGKAVPSGRISNHMMHAGIIVNELGPQMKFYSEVLGFKETWRGSRDGKVLNWVNMKVPDGEDYIEFMLHDPIPDAGKRGSAHHICLSVPDIDKALTVLKTRTAAAGYSRPLEIRTGVNRKRQLNLFDPDGTRSELMEPQTVDGKPTPSSTAPWPK